MNSVTGRIGRKTVLATNHMLMLMALTYRLIGLAVKSPPQGRALVKKVIFEQVYFTAIQALPLVIPIALILGSTLIAQFTKLSGQYDPITPPAWGQLAAETLSHSFFYEFPGIGHGVMRSNQCGLEIGLAFLDDPAAEPDTSCIDDLAGPEFK